jgi:soluble lytic murein transglycosylase-like protein
VARAPANAAAKTAARAKAAPKKPAPKKLAPPKPAAAAKAAPPAAPPASKWDELQFSLGRCYFGGEKYVEAQQTYERGAALTHDARMKATFFFHASRAAQLRGDDAGAERLMTAAIAVPGRFPATAAALTQRIRTRVRQKQFAAAANDLALVRRLTPNDRAVLDAALAYGVGMLGANNPAAALSALSSIPQALIEPYDVVELAYWRARALENSNPPAAFAEYLKVLRSTSPSHFAYFARQRLDSPAMAPKLRQELAARDEQTAKLLAAKEYVEAKRVQTDRILLSSANRAASLQRLSAIYRELPAYRTILELSPQELPRLPLKDTSDRGTLLMALGLADEAVDTIEGRYALRPAREALTRSLALNRGSASKESIYAVEILMKQVPVDYVPDLLPRVVRELLYPRYFDEFIQADAKRFQSDPTLVLSIMREESRFDPRAKSEAAARGLLQFIITTARDIGRNVGLVDVDPEDLYDPRIIIRLGAKYVAELGQQLGGNRYRIAAAYNAGPKQVALWQRMQAAPGDDYFLTSVNFDETKHYVRKVMNSYERYRELYGDGAPAGGLRIEP